MEQAAAPSSAKVAIKWSLIYVLVAIVITYAIEIAKLSVNSPVKYVTYVILIIFYFWHKRSIGINRAVTLHLAMPLLRVCYMAYLPAY